MAVSDEVANDEEVAQEAGLFDDAEFKLQPVEDGERSGMGGRRAGFPVRIACRVLSII